MGNGPFCSGPDRSVSFDGGRLALERRIILSNSQESRFRLTRLLLEGWLFFLDLNPS